MIVCVCVCVCVHIVLSVDLRLSIAFLACQLVKRAIDHYAEALGAHMYYVEILVRLSKKNSNVSEVICSVYHR